MLLYFLNFYLCIRVCVFVCVRSGGLRHKCSAYQGLRPYGHLSSDCPPVSSPYVSSPLLSIVLYYVQFYSVLYYRSLFHFIITIFFICRQICRRFYTGIIGPLYLPFLEFQRRWGKKQITTVGQAFSLLLREIPGK